MFKSRISLIFHNIIFSIKERIEKVKAVQNEEKDYTSQRQYVGNIVIAVITERITVQRALTLFPKGCDDPSVRAAWHALCHYEADEELKNKDIEFNNQQLELLEMIAFAFKDGEPLPKNIIEAYKPYYKDNPISYEKGLSGFLKKLFRFIS